MVSPLSSEEEKELVTEQEKERCNMLESILSIKLGRHQFFEPMRMLLNGDTPGKRMIDESFWCIINGRLPDSRRNELREIIRNMKNHYLNRDSVRDLHLLWHTVENMGSELFDGIKNCRKLVNQRKSLMNLLEDDTVPVAVKALNHESLLKPAMKNNYRAWELHPLFASIKNELDLMEVKRGSGIHEYSAAAKRFRKAFKKNADILERFVEANLRLVVSMVRKYYPCSIMEEMDLVQEGCQGLMEAVRRFDYRRSCKLSTYAVWWIRQYIIKAILRHSRLVRLPVSVQKEDSSINRAIDDFTLETGHKPTLDELSEYMGRNRDEIEQVYLTTAPLLSLDHTDGEHDATIAYFLKSRFQQPDVEAMHHDTRERIDTALASLSDREKTIITLRFGLLDDEPCTLQELGRIFGISRERVRQLES
ncbi:MAG: sigma-70 family RNA polymerase sigma factor, partial [Candidatus Aegiribacteria sp.]|nr:sigma-70 family RNA polymerase sigma factor [Candidatus Aegiribacteria sp.]